MSTNPTLLNAFYVAINLQGILYGIELVLYFETVHVILTLKKKQRSDILLLLFSTAMLILVTIWISTTGVLGEETWVIHGAKSPDDADAYFVSALMGRYMNLGRFATCILQLMTDALLIHRCRAIWNSTVVIIFPLVLWLTSLAFTILLSWASIYTAAHHPYPDLPTFIILIYCAVCVVLNATLTSLICYRLIRNGRQIRAEIGHEFASVYFTAAELVVESALPFTLCGIASFVVTAIDPDITAPFVWVYFMMTCISPQMLILRVLRNKDLPRNIGVSSTAVPNMRFHQWSEVSASEGGGDEGSPAKSTQP